MPLQREEVLELADHPFYDLALAGGPAPIRPRPCPTGVVFWGGRNERSVDFHPAPLPLDPREALVGQVGIVTVGVYESVPYGSLVGGRGCQPEGAYHALGVYHQGHLEPVDPLGLGGAPPEGSLTDEEPLARSPHPHHRRDERRVHDSEDRRRFGESSGECALCRARSWGSRARTRRLN